MGSILTCIFFWWVNLSHSVRFEAIFTLKVTIRVWSCLQCSFEWATCNLRHLRSRKFRWIAPRLVLCSWVTLKCWNFFWNGDYTLFGTELLLLQRRRPFGSSWKFKLAIQSKKNQRRRLIFKHWKLNWDHLEPPPFCRFDQNECKIFVPWHLACHLIFTCAAFSSKDIWSKRQFV